jgi:hypothetical protein
VGTVWSLRNELPHLVKRVRCRAFIELKHAVATDLLHFVPEFDHEWRQDVMPMALAEFAFGAHNAHAVFGAAGPERGREIESLPGERDRLLTE